MPKSPSQSGCSKRHKAPHGLFQEVGAELCSWSSPRAAAWLLLLPSLWGKCLQGPTIASPPPCHLPGPEMSRAKPNLLCSPWSCREVLSKSLMIRFT